MGIIRFLVSRAGAQLVFSLQLLGAGFLYGIHLPRRTHFICRAAAGIALYLLLAALVPNPTFLGIYFFPPLIIFILLVLLAHALLSVTWKMNLFMMVAAFASQHMATALNDVIHSCFPFEPGGLWWCATCWLSFAIVFILCYILFVRRTKKLIAEYMQSYKLIAIALIILAFVYVLRILCVEQLEALPIGNILKIGGHLYSVLGSFTSLWVLFSVNHEDKLAAENRMIEQLLREREAQQRFSSETIELVNIKCHDMKQQLALLHSSPDGTGTYEVLESMEQTVAAYDRIARSDNPALDAILTEKGLYCGSHSISLNYMADGKALSFLTSSDICAMFGNILENAIEAVQDEQPEKRIISLQVFSRRGYTCIHEENYCARPPELQNGIPVTSKRDKEYHGFGMKSIQYIVRKYDGNMAVSTPPNLFCIDILLPMPADRRS